MRFHPRSGGWTAPSLPVAQGYFRGCPQAASILTIYLQTDILHQNLEISESCGPPSLTLSKVRQGEADRGSRIEVRTSPII